MFNHDASLVSSLLVVLILRLGLLDRLCYTVYRLRNIVTAGFYEFVLEAVR